MNKLQIPTARVFQPLLAPARYKGAYGGRGSGKTEFFAGYLIDECLREPGTRVVCIREVQKTLRDSSKLSIETLIHRHQVAPYFNVMADRIVTPGNGAIIFIGMTDQTAESIKSLAQNRIAWVEEAQTLSARSLALLDPTLRWERKDASGQVVRESELLFSWNPTRKTDPVDVMFRQRDPSPDKVCVLANWRDNPFFPQSLHKARLKELNEFPERYEHTWEGGYAKAFEGAYYASLLSEAEKSGRVCNLSPDPLLPVRCYFDLGGAGAQADAMAIWVVQFVSQEIRVLEYIEGQGQVLGYYADILRRRGYENARCFLPHDGVTVNSVTGKRYRDHLAEAGFDVETIRNVGKGAATMRVEAVRRVMGRCWFDEKKTEAGRDALGFYHERRDEDRHIGLGPEHDWSSHAADAFGLMALHFEEPRINQKKGSGLGRLRGRAQGWLGG